MLYSTKRLRVNDWLNDRQRPDYLTHSNVVYLRAYKDAYQKLNRISIITYVLGKQFGIDVWSMFQSAEKQKKFCRAVIKDLKEYGVSKMWAPIFKRDTEYLEERVQYVFKIIVHNVKLTEMYPYFDKIGFERLIDFSVKLPEEREEMCSQLLRDIKEYNDSHPEEVQAHMESVRDELEAWSRHRQKISENAKAEKQAIKMAKRLSKYEGG